MRLETIWQDIRYAARGLKQKPGFAIAVVATLGLGIGANAAMFGITDRLLFRPPAFMKDPDRVHRVYLVRTFDGKENFGGWFQYTRYGDLRQWTTSFDVTAAVSSSQTAVGVGDDARNMDVASVSASYWQLFNAPPAAGRYFSAAEDTTPVGASVAVLTYPFWQSRYGGRMNAVGQRIKIAKVDYTIIGVAPEGFHGTATERVPVAFVPITTWAGTEFAWPHDITNWYAKYNISWIQMYARRKNGVSNEQATADLTSAFKRSYQKQRDMSPTTPPAELTKPRAIAGSVHAARGPQPSEVSKVARWVSGVAVIVMLIAAANVANLLLARALRRRREVAVRLALGVSRQRLVAQLVTESLVLATLGGVLGLAIAQFGGTVLRSQFFPAGEKISVIADARTLLFAAGAVIFAGLFTGLTPAFTSGRTDLATSLKAGARAGGTYHRSRMRTVLLVLQGALSVILLVGAGLFVRSLANVSSLRMGYDVDPILWVGVEERGEKLSDAERSGLRNRLEESARRIAGVSQASRAVTVPFHMSWDENIFVQGIDTAVLNRKSFRLQAAAPTYLATVGTRLLRGRFIESTDTEKSLKVMVVSESMAKLLWPAKDALGQCVRVGSDTVPCTEVVGITEDIRAGELSNDEKLFYYRPIMQAHPNGGGIFVRVNGIAARSVETVRRELQTEMPGASYVTVRPFAEIFAPNVRSWRLGATMFVVFGGLALALAAIGLYSVIAYAVVQRTHELGVRMALGAQVRDVLRLVLGEGLRLTIAGVVIGGAVALYAGRWVKPLLFNVQPTDPLVFGAVIVVLFVAATLASLIPAMRAARVDPNIALRSD